MPQATATTITPSNYFSEATARRAHTEFTISLDELKIVPHPDPIKISYGDPNYQFFPIHSLDVAVKKEPFGTEDHSSYVVERVMPDEKKLELKKAMNYYWANGHKSLLAFVKEFLLRTHAPAYNEWDIAITSGAANALNKVIETLVSKGDSVLVEEFSYVPVLAHIKEVGGKVVGVKFDVEKDGLDYEFLKDLLENWETTHPGENKPKCLYTIPTGQNPSGLTQTVEFRKKIYELAEVHDFLIIEDDPYGYITLPPYKDVKSGLVDPSKTTQEEFLNTLAKSYLSVDTRGRVIRIETFSKVFAPGLRLGFVVAHKGLLEPISILSSLASGAPAGTSQSVVTNTIQHLGGVDGWIDWLIKLSNAYIARRDLMLDTIFSSVAYKKGYVSVVDPAAGMFVSVILNFKTDPSEYAALLQNLINKTIINGVSLVVGTRLQADPSLGPERTNFVRLTIAAVANDEELVEATSRFITSVEQVFEEIKN